MVDRDDVASGHAFLQANVENETCQLLLKMWNRYEVSLVYVVWPILLASDQLLGYACAKLSILRCATGIGISATSACVLCRLKPSTQTVVSLAAEVMRLKKDKEHITVNLLKAEEEVREITWNSWCWW